MQKNSSKTKMLLLILLIVCYDAGFKWLIVATEKLLILLYFLMKVLNES